MDTMRLESVGYEPDSNQKNPDLDPKTPDLNEESVRNPDLKAGDPELNPKDNNGKVDPENSTSICITEDNKSSNGSAGLLVPGNDGSKSRKN